MKNTLIKVFVVILAFVLVGEGAFLYIQFREDADFEAMNVKFTAEPTVPTTAPTTEPTTVPTSAPETEPSTEPETEPPTEEETTEEATVETEPPTEPKPEKYTLTFVGDCTLGSTNNIYGTMYSYIWTIGEDYDYPFKNVRKYFENDDFTIANLEGNLMDEVMYSDSQFSFRGPTAYTKILTGSSVEMVTLANNHTMDFGTKGYKLTTDALDAAKLSYVEKDKSTLYTTESGLKVGVFAAAFSVNGALARDEIHKLRQQGAEVVIVAIHWGVEGAYRPNGGQTSFAHELIDYGADIVYGSHPHVLQPVEEYKDGVIFYSMANFSFGGNHWPPDVDTAILQQTFVRDSDGKLHRDELIRIPCSVSSIKDTMQNNFQPTPYEEGSDAYKRVLSKLDGTWAGPNLDVQY